MQRGDLVSVLTCNFTDTDSIRYLQFLTLPIPIPVFTFEYHTDTDTDFAKKYRLTDTDTDYTDNRSIPNVIDSQLCFYKILAF